MKDLYDRDFVEWVNRNAELLRSGRYGEADMSNIAEEIEDLGKHWRCALDSHTRQLLAHLLKLQVQPDYIGMRSWKATIANQRIEILSLLERAPSLRNEFRANLERNYADAVYLASEETGLPASCFPDRCPFTPDQLLGR